MTLIKYFTVGWNNDNMLTVIPVLKTVQRSTTPAGLEVISLAGVESPFAAARQRCCTLFLAGELFPEMDSSGVALFDSDWLISRGIVSATTIHSAWEAIYEIKQRILDADQSKCGGCDKEERVHALSSGLAE